MRNTKPIGVSMTVREADLLKDAADRSGLAQSEILRRLIYAYTSGIDVPGLPKYVPDAPADSRRR
jgi:hypothetical protein